MKRYRFQPEREKKRRAFAAYLALLDAAERLLADAGYAGITTRRLATEAGVNHGLVHYYFGSNENVLVHALERFTARLIARYSSAAGLAGIPVRPVGLPVGAEVEEAVAALLAGEA